MSNKWNRVEVEAMDQLMRGVYRAFSVVGAGQVAHSTTQLLVLLLAMPGHFKTEEDLVKFMHEETEIADVLEKEKPV